MWDGIAFQLSELLSGMGNLEGLTRVLLILFPFFLLIELPVNLLVLTGIFRWYLRRLSVTPSQSLYTPKVSCIITCYSEGRDVDGGLANETVKRSALVPHFNLERGAGRHS